MKTFITGLAAAGLAIGMASAQTTATTPGAAPSPGATTPGMTATPAMPMNGPATGTTMGATGAGTTASGTTPMRPMTGTTMGSGAGAAAAAGNNNQAVATTAANASMPAKGKNSFTMNQARTRIQARGFAQVTNLNKDNDGVWRGKGQKNGAPADVWIDYKGNVGQQ